ncbi:MAG: hypothetical protein ABJQ34_15390 [Paracoccaceae bacterium]
MQKYIIIGAGLMALSACSEISTAPANLDKQTAAAETLSGTSVNDISLVSANTINGGNFTTIGEIKTSVGKATAFGKTPTLADGQQKLRIEAAELGADAVINVQISDVTVCLISWGCRNVSGTAVRIP